MILLMAGSSEGRELLPFLLQEAEKVLVTVATDFPYNLDLKCAGDGVEIRRGRLDREAMLELIGSSGIRCLVDATHPFAAEASTTAMQACEEASIPYVRFQRRESPLPESPLIHRVRNVDEAARLACSLGETIFLTTGSKNLETFCREAKERDRKLLARVLPSPESIRRCLQAGIEQDRIVAMKGPFSARLNAALWKEQGVDAVVTKQTGKAGGLEEKVEAALENNIHLVVIDRPDLDYPACFEEIGSLLGYLRGKGVI